MVKRREVGLRDDEPPKDHSLLNKLKKAMFITYLAGAFALPITAGFAISNAYHLLKNPHNENSAYKVHKERMASGLCNSAYFLAGEAALLIGLTYGWKKISNYNEEREREKIKLEIERADKKRAESRLEKAAQNK